VRRQQLFIFMLPLPILGSHKADRLALGIGPQHPRPPGLPPKIELTLHSEVIYGGPKTQGRRMVRSDKPQ
jgi:hypothetical protein